MLHVAEEGFLVFLYRMLQTILDHGASFKKSSSLSTCGGQVKRLAEEAPQF